MSDMQKQLEKSKKKQLINKKQREKQDLLRKNDNGGVQTKNNSKTKTSVSNKTRNSLFAVLATLGITAGSMTPLWSNLAAQTQSAISQITNGFNPNTPIPPSSLPNPISPAYPTPPFAPSNPTTPTGTNNIISGSPQVPDNSGSFNPAPNNVMFNIVSTPKLELGTYTKNGVQKDNFYLTYEVYNLNSEICAYWRDINKDFAKKYPDKDIKKASMSLSYLRMDANWDKWPAGLKLLFDETAYMDSWNQAENGTATLHIRITNMDVINKMNINLQNALYPMDISIWFGSVITPKGYLQPTGIKQVENANNPDLKITNGYDLAKPNMEVETTEKDVPDNVGKTGIFSKPHPWWNVNGQKKYKTSNSFLMKNYKQNGEIIPFTEEEVSFLNTQYLSNGLITDLNGNRFFVVVPAKASLTKEGFIRVSLTGAGNDIVFGSRGVFNITKNEIRADDNAFGQYNFFKYNHQDKNGNTKWGWCSPSYWKLDPTKINVFMPLNIYNVLYHSTQGNDYLVNSKTDSSVKIDISQANGGDFWTSEMGGSIIGNGGFTTDIVNEYASHDKNQSNKSKQYDSKYLSTNQFLDFENNNQVSYKYWGDEI